MNPPPVARLVPPRLPEQASLLGARPPAPSLRPLAPASALPPPSPPLERPIFKKASIRIGQAIKEIFPAGSTFSTPGVLNEFCCGASLLVDRPDPNPTVPKLTTRIMRYVMEAGAMGFQLSEGVKKQEEELNTLSKKLAGSEKQREEAEGRAARAEDLLNEATALKNEVTQQVKDLRTELSETKQVLDSSESRANALGNQLEEARAEMEARLAAARKREETLQAEVSTLRQSINSLEIQAKDAETAHLEELEQTKVEAVKVFLESEKFAELEVKLTLQTYTDGYDLGKSRGFAAGFKRAVFMARERLGAGSSLDDLAQGDEAYASDPDIPRTPQVQLPSTPIPVEDEPEPEVAAIVEPSTEAPTEAAPEAPAPTEAPTSSAPTEAPADA